MNHLRSERRDIYSNGARILHGIGRIKECITMYEMAEVEITLQRDVG